MRGHRCDDFGGEIASAFQTTLRTTDRQEEREPPLTHTHIRIQYAPALLARQYILPYLDLISSAAFRTLSKDCRSHSTGTSRDAASPSSAASPDATCCLRDSKAFVARSLGRFNNRTVPPNSAAVRAATYPVPDVVPVMTNVLPFNDEGSSSRTNLSYIFEDTII